MKKIVAWTKFKISPPNDSVDLLEDEDDEDETPWAKKEKGRYGAIASDKLEEIISKGRIIQTPLGAINADGSEESLRLFNIWAGHTNFNLTGEHFAYIEKVPGVEALQPISSYRFQIAIGFLFNEDEVKQNIEEVLVGSSRREAIELLKVYQQLNPTLPKLAAQKLDKLINGVSRPWIAFVMPNHEIKFTVTDAVDDNFLEELSTIGLAQSLFGGYVDSSLLRG